MFGDLQGRRLISTVADFQAWRFVDLQLGSLETSRLEVGKL
jgi:hypothetical protein